MRVLRLCSVFEAPARSLSRSRGFDVIGVMQVHTARLTVELDARGVEQTVVTAYRPAAPRVELIGDRSRIVRAGIPLRRFLQLYGVAAVPKVVKAGGVDLVHVHLGEDLAIAPLARWAASRAGAPLVVTVHCSLRNTLARHDIRSTLLSVLAGQAEIRLVRAASAVLVLSDRAADQQVGSGIPRSRLRVVPVGIDLDAFGGSLPRPAEMDAGRWVVYVGRLVPEKGVHDLVAAFAKVSARGARLLIVGDGPDRGALAAAARRLGVEHRVRFVDAVSHADVMRFLKHAAVVVLPSWYEERGRIPLEAMAAGIPVVASRTGGIPSTVSDGVNGLLVPPRSPERLAAAIDRLLCDEPLAAAMGVAGRATASTHGIGALANATLAAYDAVLDRIDEPRRPPLKVVSTR